MGIWFDTGVQYPFVFSYINLAEENQRKVIISRLVLYSDGNVPAIESVELKGREKRQHYPLPKGYQSVTSYIHFCTHAYARAETHVYPIATKRRPKPNVYPDPNPTYTHNFLYTCLHSITDPTKRKEKKRKEKRHPSLPHHHHHHLLLLYPPGSTHAQTHIYPIAP